MNDSSAPGPASSDRLDPAAATQVSHPGPLPPAGDGAQAAPAPAPGAGRDGRGRFAAGNKGGPGNPFARRVAALRQTLLDALTPDDLKAIVARLVEAAQEGDVAAARLVLHYSVGKPTPAVDPDGLDLNEWEHWQQMPVPAPVLQALLGPLQVPLACTLARTVLPLLQDALGRQIAQQFNPAASVPPAGERAHPAPVANAPGAPTPEASTPPVAQAERPTSDPAPVQPPDRPGKKAAPARPERAKQPQAGTGRPSDHVAGAATGSPAEGPGMAEAELSQWLGLLEQALFPAADLAASPEALAGLWDHPPLCTG